MSRPRAIAFVAILLSAAVGAAAFFDFWPGVLLAQETWLQLKQEAVRWQLGLGFMLASRNICIAGLLCGDSAPSMK